MKRILRAVPFVFACALCALALTACAGGAASSSSSSASSSDSSSAANSSSVEASASSASERATGDAEAADLGKSIVVYYSASGNTERVAKEIASATNAEMFAIEPADPYTEHDLDWTEEDSRVNREHENEKMRNVKLKSTDVPDWDSYETVFIGYPIWWAIAAWPVDGFVSANDFSGKTVIPFCTSTSSGIGESGELLAKLAGTGDWKEGMRFASSADQEEVDEWVKSL